MFSAADSIGTSPNDWKMKATRSRRSASRSRSVIRLTSCPSTHTRPVVGSSRPPMMFSSVVLPEPDRPRRATSWPRSIVERDPAQRANRRVPAAERPADAVRRHHDPRWRASRVCAERRVCLARVHAGPLRLATSWTIRRYFPEFYA